MINQAAFGRRGINCCPNYSRCSQECKVIKNITSTKHLIYAVRCPNTDNFQFIDQSTSFPPCAVSLAAVAVGAVVGAAADSRRDCRHSTNMNSEIQWGDDFGFDSTGSCCLPQRSETHSNKERDLDRTGDLDSWSRLCLLGQEGNLSSPIVAADRNLDFAG